MKKFLFTCALLAAIHLPPIYLMDYFYEKNNVFWNNFFYNMVVINLIWMLGLALFLIFNAWFNNWKFTEHTVKTKKGKFMDLKYWIFRFWWTPYTSKSRFRVKFTKDSKYFTDDESKREYLDEAWNKLGGCSFIHPHFYSDRYVWRYVSTKDIIEVARYQYIKGKGPIVNEEYIESVELDQWITFDTDIKNSMANYKTIYNLLVFKNNPRFGGKYKTPCSISFEYQKLSVF